MAERKAQTDPAGPVDLTDTVCPMTFYRVKMHLCRIDAGEVIEIVLKAGEQMREVPRSIKEEGHRIVQVRQEGDRFYLQVRKG